MITSRRSFITGLVAFAATAPAIVRATSIMPVKQMLMTEHTWFEECAPVDAGVLEMLRQRIAAAEVLTYKAIRENIRIELYGDRLYGISGQSASIYVSDPLSRCFDNS